MDSRSGMGARTAYSCDHEGREGHPPGQKASQTIHRNRRLPPKAVRIDEAKPAQGRASVVQPRQWQLTCGPSFRILGSRKTLNPKWRWLMAGDTLGQEMGLGGAAKESEN